MSPRQGESGGSHPNSALLGACKCGRDAPLVSASLKSVHVFGAALIAALVSDAASADTAPRIEWRDCPWSQAQPAEARCGNLVVPQSRRVTAGPSIRVFFAIYRATAAAPAMPDPVVVVPGGPGALFNPPVPYVMRGLAELRQRYEVDAAFRMDGHVLNAARGVMESVA